MRLSGRLASQGAGRETTLLSLRAFYFFSFGALGALFPFLPLLLARRGLSPSEVSWVMVLLPAANMVMPPLWGTLADALRARVLLLRLASLATGAALLPLLFAHGFVGSLLAVGTFSLFRSALVPLADAATCAALGEKRASFGRVRVWGSVGFALFVLALGLAEGSMRPALLLTAACCIYWLSALCTLSLRAGPLLREHDLVRQAASLLLRPSILVFLAGNMLYYMGHATYDAYFSLHVRALGFGDPLIGTAWTIGVTVEVGVMLLAPGLLRRFGPAPLLGLCALTSALRWGLLSWVQTRLALLALQPLHGLTFGLWYLSMVGYIQARSPDRLRTSFQAVAMTTMGAGMVTGYLAGGQVLQHLGSSTLYRLAAASALAAALLYRFLGPTTAWGSSGPGAKMTRADTPAG